MRDKRENCCLCGLQVCEAFYQPFFVAGSSGKSQQSMAKFELCRYTKIPLNANEVILSRSVADFQLLSNFLTQQRVTKLFCSKSNLHVSFSWRVHNGQLNRFLFHVPSKNTMTQKLTHHTTTWKNNEMVDRREVKQYVPLNFSITQHQTTAQAVLMQQPIKCSTLT